MPALFLRVPSCGLPCPAVVVEEDAAGEAGVSGGCPVCRDAAVAPRGSTGDAPRIAGHPATFAAAVDAAATLLTRARCPLVYGLSRSPVGAARAAALVARALRAAIDIEGSDVLAPDLEALATFGLAAATFGEIRSRADVALLWRCDPRAAHPDLLPADASIFLVPPAPEGPDGGRVTGAPRGGGRGELRLLPVAPGGDLEALLVLRAFAGGAAPRAATAGGIATGDLAAAAAALRAARYAAILWDTAATAGPLGLAVASALALLARDLNDGGRAAARPLGPGRNVAGSMSALLSVAGLPRAAGFHSGDPDRLPEPLGGAAMIARGAADAMLLVGVRRIPAGITAGNAAGRPALVVVGGSLPEGCPEADVFLPAAVPGYDGAGLFQRADGVPVPVRAARVGVPRPPDPPATAPATARPQEETVLAALLARLGPAGEGS
jgi:formylmethanofuran dehydrogenase subunit B